MLERRSVLSIGLLGSLAACGGGADGISPPNNGPVQTSPFGSVEVVLDRAPGSSAQLFGVEVLVDSVSAGSRASDLAPRLMTGFTPGDYLIEVRDPTPNCQLEGVNQETVSVSDGQTATVNFSFTCTFTPVSRIAFGADLDGDGTQTIWTIRPDGTELQEVSPGFGGQPEWSPDGTRIVYFGGNGNWVANFDGSESVDFTAGDGWQATWSPDGSELVIREGTGSPPGVPPGPFSSQSDLWRVNSDGTGLQQITDDPDREWFPAWSPDGSMLAIVRASLAVDNDLQLIDLNGSFLISLGPAWTNSRSRWSPDGSKLVFAWNEPGVEPEFQIYTVNVDGSNRTQLTNMATPCGGQAFSPDGTEIIFHCDGRMWRMNADGTNQRLFAEIPGPGVGAGADWFGL